MQTHPCPWMSSAIILSLRIRGFTECAYLPEAQKSICKSNEEAVEIDWTKTGLNKNPADTVRHKLQANDSAEQVFLKDLSPLGSSHWPVSQILPEHAPSQGHHYSSDECCIVFTRPQAGIQAGEPEFSHHLRDSFSCCSQTAFRAIWQTPGGL